MARVFIGIPTLNRPRLVRETVLSVLAQTFRDFRVQVSDDGSPPEVVADVRGFVEALGRPEVAFFRQPAPALEYGQGRHLFGECREEYFAILHDDDLLDPRYLETAVARLDADPRLACFVANAHAIDLAGVRSEARTRAYDRMHGRDHHRPGPLGILGPLLDSGFFPISGTVFRAAALREAGFVDPDLDGNFPFELNLLLNLGAQGFSGWFEAERLLSFRFHGESLRKGLWWDRRIVGNVVRLLERHRFSGRPERRRVKVLSFNLRRLAAIRLGDDDRRGSLETIARALRTNPVSWKNWLFAAAALAVPFAVRPFVRRRLAGGPAPTPSPRPVESPA